MCPDPLSLQTSRQVTVRPRLLLARGGLLPGIFLQNVFSASLCSSWVVLFWELAAWAQLGSCVHCGCLWEYKRPLLGSAQGQLWAPVRVGFREQWSWAVMGTV